MTASTPAKGHAVLVGTDRRLNVSTGPKTGRRPAVVGQPYANAAERS